MEDTNLASDGLLRYRLVSLPVLARGRGYSPIAAILGPYVDLSVDSSLVDGE